MEEERKSIWNLSTLTVVALGLVGSIEYSLILPSMNKYVVERLHGTDLVYGLCMAMFSFFRVISMPILGTWSDKADMKTPFMFSVLISLAGNALYGFAEVAETYWFVLIGRALVGFGAGNTTLSMSYITRISTPETRTQYLAIMNGLNLLGLVGGPAVNLLVDFEWDTPINGLKWDKLTGPGLAMALLLTLMFLLMLFVFEEPPRPQHGEPDHHENILEQPLMSETPSENRAPSAVFRELFWKEKLWVHFVISWVSSFILGELETTCPKLTAVDFGWSTLDNSFLYAGIGIITAMTLISTAIMSKKHSDRTFIFVGMILYGVSLCLGMALLRVDPKLSVFLIVCTMCVMAAPLVDSPNMALYSKRLQSFKGTANYLGLFIGFIQANNAIARTVAPIYAGWALMLQDNHIRVYLGPLCLYIFVLVVFVTNYNTLRPKHLKTLPSIPSFIQFETIAQSPMLTPLVSTAGDDYDDDDDDDMESPILT